MEYMKVRANGVMQNLLTVVIITYFLLAVIRNVGHLCFAAIVPVNEHCACSIIQKQS